eukprot:2952716-Pyramimonas_sp.AAC.3
MLADQLSGSFSLRECHLAGNRIGADGALALSAALPHTRRLSVLNLSGNEVGCEGAGFLADLLVEAPRSPLTDLDLSANGIGDGGAADLAEALVGCTLPRLRLSLLGNEFGARARAQLRSSVESRRCGASSAVGETLCDDAARGVVKGTSSGGKTDEVEICENDGDIELLLPPEEQSPTDVCGV